jgi:tetratricopeptide (TPR) repeat protein
MGSETVAGSISNIPENRRAPFIGRATVLASLRRSLKASGTAELTQDGLGGMGASHTVLEYARRFAPDYRVVWRLRARRQALMAVDCAELAAALNLPEKAADDQRVRINAVHDWLASHDRWLIILDDFRASRESLSRFVPMGGAGHVVVTSIAGSGLGQDRSLRLASFEPAESLAFLLHGASGWTPADAQALVQVIGDAPLSLRLAKAFATATGMAPAGLADSIRRYVPERQDGAQPNLAAVIRALLNAALTRIAAEAPAAAALWALCTYLAPERIPLDLLSSAGPYVPSPLSATVNDAKALAEAARVLEQFGLVEFERGLISTHDMLQTVTRDALGQNALRQWAESAVGLVARSFPAESHYSHPIPACSLLLSHAFAATRHAEPLKAGLDDTGFLLNQMGLYLHACGEWPSAQSCCHRAVTIGANGGDNLHPAVATRLNNLGVIYKDQGQLANARDCYEKAIALLENAYGRMHESIVRPLRNLCHVLKSMDDLDAARQALGRAAELFQELRGWNHPDVADVMNELGKIWRSEGKLAKARNCFESAVMAGEGAEHPRRGQLAGCLNNLGQVLLELDLPRDSQARFERALELDRAEYGERDIQVGYDMGNVGRAMRARKHYTRARAALENAVSICQAAGGPVDSKLTRILRDLGRVMRTLGDLEGALKVFERLLAIDEVLCGKDTAEVRRDLVNLGHIHEGIEDHEQALACFERALAIEESADGRDQRNVATALSRVARALQSMGRLPEALANYQKALVIDTAACGKDSPEVARDLAGIGSALAAQGDTIEAIGHLVRAHEIFESSLGFGHQKTQRVRSELEGLGR